MPRKMAAMAVVMVVMMALVALLATPTEAAAAQQGGGLVATETQATQEERGGGPEIQHEELCEQGQTETAADEVELDADNVRMSAEQAEMLERVLYGLPQPDARLPTSTEKARMTPQEYKAALAKVWKWRQEEVRKAMESMDDEAKIMERLVGTIANATMEHSTAELLEALADAEDWVSELDHATHFGVLGGIHQSVALLAGHADSEVRTAAAYAVGSAIKNKGDLQSMALEAGVVEAVRARLEDELAPCPASETAQARECGKMLYALSSLVRGHPRSQTHLIEQGVLDVLVQLLANDNLDPRVLIKIGALVYDSFTEWPVCPAQWSTNGTSPSLCENLERQAELVLSDAFSQYPQHLQSEARIKLRQALTATGCQPERLPASFFLADASEIND